MKLHVFRPAGSNSHVRNCLKDILHHDIVLEEELDFISIYHIYILPGEYDIVETNIETNTI